MGGDPLHVCEPDFSPRSMLGEALVEGIPQTGSTSIGKTIEHAAFDASLCQEGSGSDTPAFVLSKNVKNTTREKPGKSPRTPQESPGTPVNFFLDLDDSEVQRFFPLSDVCLCEMAMETRETFEALLVGLKAEGVPPTAKALAEASGLSEEDAADILADLEKKESQKRKKGPEKAKAKKKVAKAKEAAAPTAPPVEEPAVPEEPVVPEADPIQVPDSPEAAPTHKDTPEVMLQDAQCEDTQAAELQHELELAALDAMVATHGPPPASPNKTFAVATPEKSKEIPQARFASVRFLLAHSCQQFENDILLCCQGLARGESQRLGISFLDVSF